MQGGEPQLPDGVRPGQVFAGKYRVDAILGSGAMGVVVAAHHLLLDRPVAIKFLHAASERPDSMTRFLREARSAGGLRSEHVARVLDVDVHEGDGPGIVVPYIVMERLVGSDLAALLRARGVLGVEEAVDHVLEACEAIAEAHRRGIVHRDLKPANLFLARRDGAKPLIKVLDFGIAKRATLVPQTIDLHGSPPPTAITHEKAILGSPFYMSPEQMESSGEVDARTDIWALGVTLFELVTGKPPFMGTSLVQVYARITAQGEPAWQRQGATLSPGLVAVIEKCLKADRRERYASVGELAAALAPFGSTYGRDSEARISTAAPWSDVEREGSGSLLTPRGVVAPAHDATRTTGPVSVVARTRGRWAFGAAGAVAVAGLAIALVVRSPGPRPGDGRPQEARASATAPGGEGPPSSPTEGSAGPPAPPERVESSLVAVAPAKRPPRQPARAAGALPASAPPDAAPSAAPVLSPASTTASPAVPEAGFDARALLERRE
jgi:eukaryotic-like serine/threonine-protein kinase